MFILKHVRENVVTLSLGQYLFGSHLLQNHCFLVMARCFSRMNDLKYDMSQYCLVLGCNSRNFSRPRKPLYMYLSFSVLSQTSLCVCSFVCQLNYVSPRWLSLPMPRHWWAVSPAINGVAVLTRPLVNAPVDSELFIKLVTTPPHVRSPTRIKSNKFDVLGRWTIFVPAMYTP